MSHPLQTLLPSLFVKCSYLLKARLECLAGREQLIKNIWKRNNTGLLNPYSRENPWKLQFSFGSCRLGNT